MKFLKKNKHLLIVLALFIALAAIAAGCTGKASGAENKGNDDYVVNISGADKMPHGTDFGSTDSPSSTPIPTDTPNQPQRLHRLRNPHRPRNLCRKLTMFRVTRTKHL